MSDELKNVDHSSLRTNQAFIITFLLVAFITDQIWLVALVALVMLLGTVLQRPGFGLLYIKILRPIGLVRPDILRDNPEPHRFAQGFGSAVLWIAILGFLLGSPIPGWALVWLVIILAMLNLFVGFCTGCAVYYWLHRIHAPGFVKDPPAGTFPGMRPRMR